jgi:hypothetical protein
MEADSSVPTMVASEPVQVEPAEPTAIPTLSSLDIQVDSSTRIFPEARFTQEKTVPLSILDATVARFAATAAAWLYDRSTNTDALSTERLKVSLEKTLNYYPQWTGTLHFAPYNAEGGHTERFGRLMLSYGSTSDPGVHFLVTHSQVRLSSLIPSPSEREAGSGIYDITAIPIAELLPEEQKLALYNMKDFEGLPCMIVQLTTFACGGISIAVKMAHPLADAQCMVQFVHDWAGINRALSANSTLPTISRPFDPSLLDRAASGDIDAPDPDPELIKCSRELPVRRFDWWLSGDQCPWPTNAGHIPPEIAAKGLVEPFGTPMPWNEWDVFAPVSHCLIYFTAEELQRISEDASSMGTSRISRLDALLGHVWHLLSCARKLDGDETSDLHITFGARGRVSPPLPETFIGSPIILTCVTGSKAMSREARASAIRSSICAFTPSNLGAFLHDKAYEATPQRIWNAFLGKCNTIVTSWLRLGVYQMDFGGGSTPRYVEAIMPSVDGCIQIMESGVSPSVQGGDLKKVHWADERVCVSLYLKRDVMESFLDNPQLRKYRSNAVHAGSLR